MIDDDMDDQLLIEDAFKDNSDDYKLEFACDGLEGIQKLNHQKLPDLILLDLNMPRMNGFEVLARIKMSPSLSHIPIFILSTSTRPDDINFAHQLGASNYFVKPNKMNELASFVSKVRDFLSNQKRIK